MIVLIDIDSTVADCLPYWLDEIHKEHGIKAEMEHVDKWDMAACPPLDQVGPQKVYGMLQRPGFNLNMPIMPGAAEAIKKLIDLGDKVYLVTARKGAVCMAETFDWIKKHLPFLKENQLIFCADKHLLKGDVMIEDKPEYILSCLEEGMDVIGIEYAYNRHLLNESGVVLVKHGPDAWKQILHYLTDTGEHDV